LVAGSDLRTGKHFGKRMNIKRMRGRNHRNGGGGGGNGGGGGGVPIRHHQGGGIPLNRNHVFDSNGPDMRIRGTAQQLFEKYLQLGRDASGSGDRVMAESYFQYAEHYFRILTVMTQAQQQGPQNGQHQPRRPMANDMGGPEPAGDGDGDDHGQAPPGMGDQPSHGGSREIPIVASPPEG
jgi:hypothetical protein